MVELIFVDDFNPDAANALFSLFSPQIMLSQLKIALKDCGTWLGFPFDASTESGEVKIRELFRLLQYLVVAMLRIPCLTIRFWHLTLNVFLIADGIDITFNYGCFMNILKLFFKAYS